VNWIDNAIARTLITVKMFPDTRAIVFQDDYNRLLSEARKMERVREWFAEFGIDGWDDELRDILEEDE